MNSTKNILGGLAAALTLGLSSCGDKEPSANQNPNAAAPPGSSDTYPLKVCVVSGEELGSMGAPVVLDHQGTEVRFCCKECLPKFKADPEKYLAKLKSGEPSPNQ